MPRPTSLALPDSLTPDQWLEVGQALGRARGSVMWWVGDWWAFGEHAYGDRSSAVKGDDWEGPAFGTCQNAASVCRRFETSSRDEVVSFRVHQAIAPISNESMRLDVLAWAASPGDNGALPLFREVEDKVRAAKAFLAQGWTPDQLARKAQAETGQCVVANMRSGDDGQRTDEALLSWAEAEGRFVRIDRQSDWGNRVRRRMRPASRT
jgi:hypothetical protein